MDECTNRLSHLLQIRFQRPFGTRLMLLSDLLLWALSVSLWWSGGECLWRCSSHSQHRHQVPPRLHLHKWNRLRLWKLVGCRGLMSTVWIGHGSTTLFVGLSRVEFTRGNVGSSSPGISVPTRRISPTHQHREKAQHLLFRGDAIIQVESDLSFYVLLFSFNTSAHRWHTSPSTSAA